VMTTTYVVIGTMAVILVAYGVGRLIIWMDSDDQ
jgi:hypothetical protein